MSNQQPARTYREELLGVPEAVQAEVDLDLLAATRGPRALDSRLDKAEPAAVRTRYEALLGRSTYPLSPASPRARLEDTARAVAADEDQHIRRGAAR